MSTEPADEPAAEDVAKLRARGIALSREADGVRAEDPGRALSLYRESGRLLGRAAEEEQEEVARLQLIGLALLRLHHAHELSPEDTEISHEALTLCQRSGFDEPAAVGEPTEMKGRITELCEAFAETTAETPISTEEAKSATPSPDRVEKSPDHTTRRALAGPPVNSVDESPGPSFQPKGLKIGLWLSLGLTAGLGAISLGTGLSRLKTPFRGAAWKDVNDAITQSDGTSTAISQDPACGHARAPGSDDGGVYNADVARACDRYDALGRVTIATGVLGGIAAASALMFMGLILRDRHKRAALGRRSATVGFSLGREGAALSLRSRF